MSVAQSVKLDRAAAVVSDSERLVDQLANRIGGLGVELADVAGNLQEVAGLMKLGRKVMTTGNGAKIRGFLEVKKRWTGDFEYEFQDQSSVRGAAMLGQMYQKQHEESSKAQTLTAEGRWR